jgi:hypothetical protein
MVYTEAYGITTSATMMEKCKGLGEKDREWRTCNRYVKSEDELSNSAREMGTEEGVRMYGKWSAAEKMTLHCEFVVRFGRALADLVCSFEGAWFG